MCFSIELDDLVCYNFYNHYLESYVILYAFSEKTGYIKIKIDKTDQWQEMLESIKFGGIYPPYNLPKHIYDNKIKDSVVISYNIFQIIACKLDIMEPTFVANEIIIYGNKWTKRS